MGKDGFEERREIASGIIALFAAGCYWFWALSLKKDSILGVDTLGNIKCYVIFVVIFAGTFLVAYLGSKKFDIIRSQYNRNISKVAVLSMTLIAVALSVPVFAGDRWVFPVCVTVVILIVGLICFYESIKMETDKCKRATPYLLIFIGCILAGIYAATVNTFSPTGVGSWYDIHHSSAFIDQIYYISNGSGFHGGITDQYGHYALLWLLPIKIFGLSTRTIAIFLGILNGLTLGLFMLSFCRIVRSNAIRCFVIVLGWIYTIGGQNIYWQSLPHRLLFPALTLFWITVIGVQNNLKKSVLSFILATIAVISNFESGIICCLAFAALSVMMYLQRSPFSFRLLGNIFLRVLFWMLLPVFCAWCVVNAYNVICVTELLSIKEFMGMAVASDYIDDLRTVLKWGNKSYLHQTIIFLICFLWGGVHNKFWGKSGNESKAYYSAVVAIFGLGMNIYHINRTLSGDGLVRFFFVICLGLILSGATDTMKGDLVWPSDGYIWSKIALGIYAFCVLLECGLSKIDFYQTFVNRVETKAYDYRYFKDFTDKIAETVPQDTWAMGEGTSAIYMELGWKKGTWAFSEVQGDEIRDQTEVFLNRSHYHLVPISFELVEEFEYGEGDVSFGYFRRSSLEDIYFTILPKADISKGISTDGTGLFLEDRGKLLRCKESPEENRRYQLVFDGYHLAFDIPEDRVDDDGTVSVWEPNDSTAQMWYFEIVDEEYYVIHFRDKWVLACDLTDGSVKLAEYTGEDDQLWKLDRSDAK